MLRFASLRVVAGGDLLHVGETLPVVVVVGTEMVLIVELARVAFVAYCAIEEPHGVWDGVIALLMLVCDACARLDVCRHTGGILSYD